MNDWNRSDTTDGNGYYWSLTTGEHTEDCQDGIEECACNVETISVFETTEAGLEGFYAWLGTFDDHDREMGKSMTGLYPTRDEAVAALGVN